MGIYSRMRKLSTSQAAEELGVTRQHVARLCAAGVLKSVRIGERGWNKVLLPDKKPNETPQRSN